MRKILYTPLEVITEMALYYSLSYIVEMRIRLVFSQMNEVAAFNTIDRVTTNHIAKIFGHWRGQDSTAENLRKRIGYIRRVMKYAHSRGYIKRNCAELFRLPKLPRSEIVTITQDELTKLEKLNVFMPALLKVRDVFLFQCYTGIAYVDLKRFSKTSLQERNGRRYICDVRAKTEAPYTVPLIQEALSIADKYNYCLPVYSNAGYNKHLKTVGAHAKIETKLTTHVARRTFGQLMIDRGISLETVSRMMGHKSTGITERYYARAGMIRVMNEVGHLAA